MGVYAFMARLALAAVAALLIANAGVLALAWLLS